VLRFAAIPLVALSLLATDAKVTPLSPTQKHTLKDGFWRSGCPVALSQLRALTVLHWGFDGKRHKGQLIVNADVADELATVFRKLYALKFPIRHMQIADYYGPSAGRPKDGDVTESFECRQASASPCGGLGNKRTGTWSNHAYGHAVDLNPVENPYVGCGMSRDPLAQKYRDRSVQRKGMVTPAVVAAFRSVGWGWGGSWTGDTKDYMHFSTNGH
jgi:hypothetical protein